MKTLDELMQHLCDNSIACSGELQKRELKNLGYYHGYKGYRFAGIAKNRLHLQSFKQISSLNSFDMALKSFNLPLDHRRGNRFEELHIGGSSSRCRVTIS